MDFFWHARWVNPEIRNKRVKVDNKTRISYSLSKMHVVAKGASFADPQTF